MEGLRWFRDGGDGGGGGGGGGGRFRGLGSRGGELEKS